jgi:hypothetical protein
MIASRRTLKLFACLILIALLLSCYESSIPLSKPGVNVDPVLLGRWQCVPDPRGESDENAVLSIFRFDNYQYYAEWKEKAEATRYRAYATVLDGSTLLNVRQISPDSESEKWLFIRYKVTQSKTLNLAVVNEKAITSPNENGALQEIQKRVAEDALYQSFASCTRLQ